MKKVIIMFFVLFSFIPFVKAEDTVLAPNAKSSIIMEYSTGKILYEFNSHEKMAPASMTKMMSLLLIMEAIENGNLKWDDMITVSSNASSMGGSQILLETGEQMSVEDLVKGVSIASGNDAVVALAEAVAGTEENFVNMMNDKAKELELNDTNFKNCHGLDEANHYSSAHDMAVIARNLVSHEKILEFSSIYETYLRENTDRKIWLVNTNKLVRFKQGVDGLKTGFTDTAGYCLTATMKKDDMRVIATVMGESDASTRNTEVGQMLDYAFSMYKLDKVLSKDSIVKVKNINKAKVDKINIVPSRDVTVLSKKTDNINPTYKIKVNDLKVPIKKGDVIGKLTVYNDSEIIDNIDLTVDEDIKKANIIELYLKYLKDILSGDIKI